MAEYKLLQNRVLVIWTRDCYDKGKDVYEGPAA
jgi:hypothetical protein